MSDYKITKVSSNFKYLLSLQQEYDYMILKISFSITYLMVLGIESII